VRGLYGPFSKALGWIFVAFLVLPMVALVWYSSKEQVWPSLGNPDTRTAIVVSLKTSLACMALVLVFGTGAAVLVARAGGFWKIALETLTGLPMVLPPSAAGIALLLAFGRKGLLGPQLDAVGVHLPFTASAVVLAQCFVAAPFYVRSAAEGLESVSKEALESAVLDGASRWALFTGVIWPLASPFLIAGLFLSWARALGEFGATILFAGNLPGVTQTMPLAIYLGFESDLGQATGLALLLLFVAAVVLVIGRLLLPRQRF
jgi:molybdate transport system permease protein